MLTDDGMNSGLIVLMAIFAASLIGLLGLIIYLLRRRSPRVQRHKTDAKADRALKKQAKAEGGRKRDISRAALHIAEIEDLHDTPGNAPPQADTSQPEADSPPANAASMAAAHPAAGTQSVNPQSVKRQPASAVVFRRHFPPMLGLGGGSFFGGLPQVRAPFDWPRGADGRPLHFVLQVDLAQVPASATSAAHPGAGLLLVFIELEWGTQPSFRVLLDPAGAGPLMEIVPPEDIALAYGAAGAHVWPWALGPEYGTPILPHWPFDPVAVPVDAHGIPAVDALIAAQGEDIQADPFGLHDFEGMTRPWHGFPQNWLSVQIASAQLVRETERAARGALAELWPELDEAQRTTLLAQTHDEARAWFDHALANPAFDDIGPGTRDAFWHWFAEQAPLSLAVAPHAFEAAIETSLHAQPECAAALPLDVLMRVIHRHALVVRIDDGYHIQAAARLFAPPSTHPQAEAELARTHVLLLELASDPAIGFYFGEAIHRFWITPEDLAAGLFDDVVMTTTDS